MSDYDRDGSGKIILGPKTAQFVARLLRNRGVVDIPATVEGIGYRLFVAEADCMIDSDGTDRDLSDYLYFGIRAPGRLALQSASTSLPKTMVSDWRIGGLPI